MTVEQQLQLFMEYKVKVGSIPGRALYLICWGSNDVIQHFTFTYGSTDPGYAEFMTQRASTFIQVPSLAYTFCSYMLHCCSYSELKKP